MKTNKKPVAITVTGINRLITDLKSGLKDNYDLLGETNEEQIERFGEVFDYSLSGEDEDIHTVGYIMGIEYAIRELEKLINN